MDLKEQTNIPLKDQLRFARERLGLTQDAVAKAIGVTTQSVKYWEGEGNKVPIPTPRGPKLAALERLLKVRLSPTGNLTENMPDYTEGISAEVIEIAKIIESMPSDTRQMIMMLVDRLQPHQGTSKSRPLPFLKFKKHGRSQTKLVGDSGGGKRGNEN